MSKKRKPNVKKTKNPVVSVGKYLEAKEAVSFICLECDDHEAIPLHVVRQMDAMDDGDPTVPPQFRCEQCGGAMYPEHYTGVHGYEYKITDIRPT